MILTPIVISLTAAAIAVVRHERRARNRALIEYHYLQLLLLGENHSERYLEELSHLAGGRVKRAAAEIVADLSPIIYRLDRQWVESTTRSLHLTEYLLRQIHTSRGTLRVRYLSVLSRIPHPTCTPQQLEPYTLSEDRMVRFFALLATINTDRENTMRYIANYSSPLTPFESSQLLSMLRQGAIAIAYQPMLKSSSANLIELGIAVVRHFAIEEAEPELREIVAQSRLYHLQREALYALSSMQLLLCTPQIGSLVKLMPPLERWRFVRHIASEGYSQSVVDFFATQQQRPQLHSRINSYKIKLEC